jgi:TBC1 domain family member 2
MRRKGKRLPAPKGQGPGGGLGSVFQASADTGDIAEERGPPNYPTTKKSEGKILRPQYKEILRGKAVLNVLKIRANRAT